MTQPTAGEMTAEERAEQIAKAFVTSGSHDDLELFLATALSAAEERGIQKGLLFKSAFEEAAGLRPLETYSAEKIVSAIRARSRKQEGNAE